MKPASSSCCIFDCVVLAAAYLRYRRYRLSCLLFVWHLFSLWYIHTHTHGWVSEVFVSTDARRGSPSWCNRKRGGRVSQRYRFDPVDGNGHFFLHNITSIFRLSLTPPPPHTHTHTPPTEACVVITDDDALHRNVLQLLIEDQSIPSSVFTVHSINDEGDINKIVRLSH